MADILFLAHRIPYPPTKGDKIRSWHFLRHLAQRHCVHLGAFVDDPQDWRHVPFLAGLAASACFRPLGRARQMARLPRALLQGEALSVTAYHDRALARWIDGRLASGIDLVLAYSGASAGPLLHETRRRPPVLLDLVDCDSAKWQALAETARGPKRALLAREARLVLAHERRAAARSARTVLVSESEAALARRLLPESGPTIGSVPNGVDTAYFDPAAGPFPNPYAGSAAPVLVFTGVMDYAPNIEAVVWLARSVLPRLRAAGIACRFVVVGARPAREVTRLSRLPDVMVTGRVPDVRPYLAHAALAVAPLQVARGIQNKVLEAMAMALPVVATPAAAEGIDAEPERHLLAACDPAAFASAIHRLLAGPDGAVALGTRARARVVERHGWAAALARLDQAVEAALGAAQAGFRDAGRGELLDQPRVRLPGVASA
jgi:sugar transferase (PEP-CTERM/EpsH1 system associated)